MYNGYSRIRITVAELLRTRTQGHRLLLALVILNVVAILIPKTLYAQTDAFFPSSLWSDHFSDEQDWHADPAYWGTIRFPDLNGDGNADVCGRGVAGIWCALSDGSDFLDPALRTTHFSDDQGWNSDPAYWDTIRFPDLNGDGNADVCGRGVAGIWCALSDGSDFLDPALRTTHFSDDQDWHADPAYWDTIRFPDLNGDGNADVCGRGVNGIWCALSDGSDFLDPALRTTHFNDEQGWNADPAYWDTIRFPDLNGDGNADVCGRGVAGIWCALSDGSDFLDPALRTTHFSDDQDWHADPAYWDTIRFPDLNGDGNADVCGRGVNGIWCALSDGSDFLDPALWTTHFSDDQGWNGDPAYWATIRFPEVGNDGRADVCGRGVAGIWCAASTGSAFGRPALRLKAFTDDQGWNSDPAYWKTIRFPDLNGNGTADVCGRGVNGIVCAPRIYRLYLPLAWW